MKQYCSEQKYANILAVISFRPMISPFHNSCPMLKVFQKAEVLLTTVTETGFISKACEMYPHLQVTL